MIACADADTYGARRVLVVSMLGSAVCFLAMIASTSLNQLLVFRFVCGLFAGIGTVLTAYIIDASPREAPSATGAASLSESRPVLLNAFNMAWNVAGVSSGGVVWWLGGDVVACGVVASVCMAAATALVVLLLPLTPDAAASVTTPPLRAQTTKDAPSALLALRALVADPLSRWMLLIGALSPPFDVSPVRRQRATWWFATHMQPPIGLASKFRASGVVVSLQRKWCSCVRVCCVCMCVIEYACANVSSSLRVSMPH